jgi:hypothetical protein
MGRVLTGTDPVADTGLGHLLGRAITALAQGNTLGSGAVRARRLSTDRAGQRVALASRVVRPHTLADLLGADEALADPHVLYECHDRLLAHKEALFTPLTGRWRDLFNVSFEVLSPSNPRWPSTSKALIASLPPRPLQLLPAGEAVAGWVYLPLRERTFSRRTRSSVNTLDSPMSCIAIFLGDVPLSATGDRSFRDPGQP